MTRLRHLGLAGLGLSFLGVFVAPACGGDGTETSGSGASTSSPTSGGTNGGGAGGASTGGMGPGGDGGSAGGCGDTTSDPMNCGVCGEMCLSGVCIDSACEPALVGCYDAGPGDTCDAVCASYGGTCAAAGCEGLSLGTMVTMRSFPSEASCTNQTSPSGENDASCSAVILDVAAADWTECCCR